MSAEAILQQLADELRNVRKGCDWNAPPPGSLYAALRGMENLARQALGQPLAADFRHNGKYTEL